jgi:hypothetical protein
MNFKPELLAKVLNEEKTQTRRPIRGVDMAIDIHGTPGALDSPDFWRLSTIKTVLDEKGRVRYEVGKAYAVCPGRGKSGQGHIVLTQIRHEDVRDISADDVHAEGFTNRLDFLKVWCGFYDKAQAKHYEGVTLDDSSDVFASLLLRLMQRPFELYEAWALTFELVK